MAKLVRPKRAIILKSLREIELMRVAGDLVYRALSEVRKQAVPGVTTGQLNTLAEEMIEAAGAKALFKGVTHPSAKFPFPAALCTSINEEIVHGVPGDRKLREGDVLSVDCGVKLKGYCGDSATTIAIGEVGGDVRKLLATTSHVLDIAIREMKPGRLWSEIASQMQKHAERNGFSVVRDFVGHGIGQEMHEDPKVPNYSDAKMRRDDFELQPGMVLAVEPMVNIGTSRVMYADDDGWTVITKDRKCSAHFEHTIAVTDRGADVLTDGR